ncbi:MAG TPA: SIS domain-containing protein [Acidobacteriota bacterium]|nr:SIS domain-containing protein [Acidobacteriota bacterium]
MTLHSEICEQPECLDRLVRTKRKAAEEIARHINERDIRYVFVAARGTSENAARYANYLWGARNGLPIALAAPSLFTYYDCPPRLRGALVVGISQSGRSPDIVSVVAEGKRQECLTLAITNAVDSPLAQVADFVLDIDAGEENAVAATKTYSAELMAIAMLSTALRQEKSEWQILARVPGWTAEALGHDSVLPDQVQRYRAMSSCVVLGRGFNYATAYEWALKLKELTYVEAEPYSSADFMHGPIAMVNSGFPILAVVPAGAVYASTIEVLRNLRHDRSAELLVISDEPEALALAQTSLSLPPGIPEWLSPLVSIVPAQLFCYHLALARGCDTESPRGIHKVTETR